MDTEINFNIMWTFTVMIWRSCMQDIRCVTSFKQSLMPVFWIALGLWVLPLGAFASLSFVFIAKSLSSFRFSSSSISNNTILAFSLTFPPYKM